MKKYSYYTTIEHETEVDIRELMDELDDSMLRDYILSRKDTKQDPFERADFLNMSIEERVYWMYARGEFNLSMLLERVAGLRLTPMEKELLNKVLNS